jgi:hypothetical protein
MQGINEYEGITLPWDLYLIPDGPLVTGKDSHGKYFIMTGLEGSGKCWLCGADPGGKNRRYCWGHGTRYCELFIWTYASSAALKRDHHRCRNCGGTAGGIEVHHIIPLEGRSRFCTHYNLPWNLITLCHYCHMEIHTIMRPDGWTKLLTKAESRGQLIFEGLT